MDWLNRLTESKLMSINIKESSNQSRGNAFCLERNWKISKASQLHHIFLWAKREVISRTFHRHRL